jgi:hypothetical protein
MVALACGSNDPELTEQREPSQASLELGRVATEEGNSQLADVDVFEIVPEVAYPAAYDECIAYVNNVEIPQNLRPKYKNDITNIAAEYETIFVGGPIWWGQPPMIIHTFLEAHPELDGKTIIPFGTHGGSGVGSYKTLIQGYFPKATILESLGISGSSIRDAASKTTVEN